MNLKGILTDVVSNAVKQHISGGNQNRQQQPQQPTSGGSGASSGYPPAGQNFGGYDPYAPQGGQGGNQGGYQPAQPTNPTSTMYGQGLNLGFNFDKNQGYPPYNHGPPQGYHPPDPGYYPSQGSSYPPQTGMYNQNQGYPGGPGYPQDGPGYPPQSGSGAYAPYPMDNQMPGGPGFGSGYTQGPGGAAGYPPQPGHGSSPYPSAHGSSQYPGGPPSGHGSPYPQPGGHGGSYGGGMYPTMAMDQVNQQHYGQGGGMGGGQGGYQKSYGQVMNANPSIRPSNVFNANADAETLRKAMKGFGTNNAKVIQVICGRTNWERQEISKAFKVMYGKDLIKDLKSELSGDFEDLVLALMDPPAVYDAKQLYKAMAGFGTKESVLIEIMCSRTNAQIHAVKLAYKQLYGKDLEKELIGETSGHFKRLLVSLCAGARDESMRTDPLKANQDARNLYRAGEARLGTDESAFNAILASQNYAQLRLVFDEYQKVTSHSIEQAINSEFSGDIQDGLIAIVKIIKNRPAYFAELLYLSMKGFGTRDNDLIRLCVTRAELDMRDIRTEYQRMYKTSLENAIAGDCSGNYKEGLIALVKGNY